MTAKTKIVQKSLEQASRTILMRRENGRVATVEAKFMKFSQLF